jgi:hypothetical protein
MTVLINSNGRRRLLPAKAATVTVAGAPAEIDRPGVSVIIS